MSSVQQARQATKSLGTVAPHVILSYRSRQFRCRHTKAVGITTGSNDFFTVPQSVVSMYQLEEYARPMVGRSVQVNSLCFTKRDWKANVASEAKAHLLVFTLDAKENGNEGVNAYLESGVATRFSDCWQY